MRKSACRVAVVAAIVLSGCTQFTTSNKERADLQAAAEKAGDAYADCIVEASQRYQGTNETVTVILDASKRACSDARGTYERADTRYLKSKFMLTDRVVKRDVEEYEKRASGQVEEQVLARKTAAPAPVAAAASASAAPAAPAPAAAMAPAAAAAPAGPPASDGKAYLDCMRAQGERYAGVNEPAQVVAEVAHSRCAKELTDPASAAQLERQGRALVMGMVLDRKVGQ